MCDASRDKMRKAISCIKPSQNYLKTFRLKTLRSLKTFMRSVCIKFCAISTSFDLTSLFQQLNGTFRRQRCWRPYFTKQSTQLVSKYYYKTLLQTSSHSDIVLPKCKSCVILTTKSALPGETVSETSNLQSELVYGLKVLPIGYVENFGSI